MAGSVNRTDELAAEADLGAVLESLSAGKMAQCTGAAVFAPLLWHSLPAEVT
jgi:hypothetical protein